MIVKLLYVESGYCLQWMSWRSDLLFMVMNRMTVIHRQMGCSLLSPLTGQQGPNLVYPWSLIQHTTVEPWYKDHLWAAAKVVFIVRWSLYCGGSGCDLGCTNRQMVFISRWFYNGVYGKTWTGCAKSGLYSKVVSISRWSLTKVRLYKMTISLYMWESGLEPHWQGTSK